jgi:hypothetical protein
VQLVTQRRFGVDSGCAARGHNDGCALTSQLCEEPDVGRLDTRCRSTETSVPRRSRRSLCCLHMSRQVLRCVCVLCRRLRLKLDTLSGAKGNASARRILSNQPAPEVSTCCHPCPLCDISMVTMAISQVVAKHQVCTLGHSGTSDLFRNRALRYNRKSSSQLSSSQEIREV